MNLTTKWSLCCRYCCCCFEFLKKFTQEGVLCKEKTAGGWETHREVGRPGEGKSSLDLVFPCMVPLVVERNRPESQAYILLLWKNQDEGMSSEGLAAGFGMSPKPCCCCHGKVCSKGLKEVEFPLFDTPLSFLTPHSGDYLFLLSLKGHQRFQSRPLGSVCRTCGEAGHCDSRNM